MLPYSITYATFVLFRQPCYPPCLPPIGLAETLLCSLRFWRDYYIVLCIWYTNMIINYCSIWTSTIWVVDSLTDYLFLSYYLSTVRSSYLSSIVSSLSLVLLLQEVLSLLLSLISKPLLLSLKISQNLYSTELRISRILIQFKEMNITFRAVLSKCLVRLKFNSLRDQHHRPSRLAFNIRKFLFRKFFV